jgi:four helix bundle protein
MSQDDRRPKTEDRLRVMDDGRRMTEDRRKATEDSPSFPVFGPPAYKFQRLDVYRLALEYLDRIYAVAHHFPEPEKFNLRSQIERAATSIVLNIAEGSTGQSDPEQSRFTSMALRSYLETVACFDIAERRGYLASRDLQSIRDSGHQLFVKLSALRRSLRATVPGPRSPVS